MEVQILFIMVVRSTLSALCIFKYCVFIKAPSESSIEAEHPYTPTEINISEQIGILVNESCSEKIITLNMYLFGFNESTKNNYIAMFIIFPQCSGFFDVHRPVIQVLLDDKGCANKNLSFEIRQKGCNSLKLTRIKI